MDPFLLTAAATVVSAALSAWGATRKYALKREQMIDERSHIQFERAERERAELKDRIQELSERVEALEKERNEMVQWMAWNQISWPPPEDWGL